MNRRTILKTFGASLPFAEISFGLLPVAWAAGPVIPGKKGLRILSDRPINAETPVTQLDDDLTPNHLHFVRNNGRVPHRANSQSLGDWTLTVDGEVERPLTLDMPALRALPKVSGAYVLECGGNGRAGFRPRTRGNQWTLGAVGCARYEGIRLKDLLRKAGLKDSAVYVAYYGEDVHLSGDPHKVVISRGVPIAKALDPHTILAWSMNGEPLPALHGFPLRLICPGWPASASGKWLRRIWVRDRVHDGPKMTGDSYRIPVSPVRPGTKVPVEHMEIIERMPVKSIITRPGTGTRVRLRHPVPLRGHAWSGHGAIRSVHVSTNFGATWIESNLARPRNPWAWQRWTASLSFDRAGYYEVWARATDETGAMQPMVVPHWNPKGYLNNAMHRIALEIV